MLPDSEHSTSVRAGLAIAYLIAAALWRRAGLREAGTEILLKRFWTFGAILLCILSVNKAFDLRHQCELLMRMTAKAGGWYEHRQPVQFFLAIVLPASGLFLVSAFFVSSGGKFLRQRPLALFGWSFLFLYLALRQTQEWKPAINWLNSIEYYRWRLGLEVAGIGFVMVSAVTTGKVKKPNSRH